MHLEEEAFQLNIDLLTEYREKFMFAALCILSQDLVRFQGPLLLTWFNFNLGMDK